MNWIALLYFLPGVAFVALGRPLANRRVGMNDWYGVRIPEAFRSEARWLELNEFGGRLVVVWGWIINGFALLALAAPPALRAPIAGGFVALLLGGVALTSSAVLIYASMTRSRS